MADMTLIVIPASSLAIIAMLVFTGLDITSGIINIRTTLINIGLTIGLVASAFLSASFMEWAWS